MRTYKEIYQELQSTTNGRFTTLEALKIYKNENGNWVGSSQQVMQISGMSHEITGIRVGECSGCRIMAISNMIRWLNNHEEDILQQLKPIKKK